MDRAIVGGAETNGNDKRRYYELIIMIITKDEYNRHES